MTTAATTKERTSVVIHTRVDCRMCGSTKLEKVWSFGQTPLANAYLKPLDVARGKPEPFAPLDVYVCDTCHLVQLRDIVDPDVLFSNYLYVSSTSPKFVAHFEEYAQHLIERFGLTNKSLVVDVGSNDGVLLKPLQASGMRTLGVEPAKNIAAIANRKGIETVAEYFTPAVARRLRKKYGPAAIITANNVFAHTDRVDVFVQAVQELLANNGVFVFEVQYLADLIANNLFDIVYHEHVCYYHVQPLVRFFEKHDMEVFDVEHVPVHGGSIRVFVSRTGASGTHGASQFRITKRLTSILAAEESQGLNTLVPHKAFAARIEHNKHMLTSLLADLKKQGKRIVGYGAPAKATTLCYAFGIDGSTLDYIVDDDTKFKQGRLMPGTHIPIASPDQLYEDKPDYCLILAWNFTEPIMANHKRFTKQGGKFIIPTPNPRIV